MTVKDIDELAGEKYLRSQDVDARVADLSRASRDDYMDEGSWESGQGELRELEDFVTEVAGYVGPERWHRGITMIADRAWDEFAEEEAEVLYGRAALDSGYFALDKCAYDLQAQYYKSASLAGYEFWFRG